MDHAAERLHRHPAPLEGLPPGELRLAAGWGAGHGGTLELARATLAEGETLGMLGHNGSGKSTLLKCIAGIILPTTGTIRSKGRTASLLELGAGFEPEAMREHLMAAGFAKWQCPDRYECIDAIPRTSTGKFWKLKLRERFAR